MFYICRLFWYTRVWIVLAIMLIALSVVNSLVMILILLNSRSLHFVQKAGVWCCRIIVSIWFLVLSCLEVGAIKHVMNKYPLLGFCFPNKWIQKTNNYLSILTILLDMIKMFLVYSLKKFKQHIWPIQSFFTSDTNTIPIPIQ